MFFMLETSYLAASALWMIRKSQGVPTTDWGQAAVVPVVCLVRYLQSCCMELTKEGTEAQPAADGAPDGASADENNEGDQ